MVLEEVDINTELPMELHMLAVDYLRKNMGYRLRQEVIRLHNLNDAYPPEFIATVVDLLECNVAAECELLSGEWRDYAIQLVLEAVC